MNDFEFYIGVIGFTLIYWSILYFLFHKFRKDKLRPVYKLVSYWLTSIFSFITIYIIGIIIFISSIFGSSDYTDSTIEYGNEIMAGEYDGLMYTDWVKLYDNSTFHILSNQIESNGKYLITKDTIELFHNKKYTESSLPDFFVIRGQSLYGYRKIDNQIDSTTFLHFGLYIYPDKTIP